MRPPAEPTASPLWHITLLAAGPPAPEQQLAQGLRELCALDPGNMAARYRANQVELQFWDEGPDLQRVAASATVLWREGRAEAGLPDWSLVGLEVLDRQRWGERQAAVPRAIRPGSVATM